MKLEELQAKFDKGKLVGLKVEEIYEEIKIRASDGYERYVVSVPMILCDGISEQLDTDGFTTQLLESDMNNDTAKLAIYWNLEKQEN